VAGIPLSGIDNRQGPPYLAVVVQCRQCGKEWPRDEAVDVASGRGCPSCGGSPLCAECGHPRKEHTGAFGASSRGCRARSFDLQTLTATTCNCTGYVKRTGDFAETPFAEPKPLPSLRIASREQFSATRTSKKIY
jgi:hypothetical protein